MSQIDIFGQVKPLGRVAPNQETVLKLLAAHPDGCTADEIGAAIHASRGKHEADELCAFCSSDSRDVIRALERKRLVRRAGNGQFVLRIEEEKPSGMSDEIPY